MEPCLAEGMNYYCKRNHFQRRLLLSAKRKLEDSPASNALTEPIASISASEASAPNNLYLFQVNSYTN